MDEDQRDDGGSNLIETDMPSRGELRIEQLKAAPRGPFHFGLFGLMCVMVAAAGFVALPRWYDISYTGYFALWYGLFYACAPLVGWTIATACPAVMGRWRLVLAGVVTAGLILPVLFIAALQGAAFFPIFFGSVFLLWLPQIICIAGLRYFVFK